MRGPGSFLKIPAFRQCLLQIILRPPLQEPRGGTSQTRYTSRVADAFRILGIDPGSLVTGFGVLEPRGSRLVLIEAGCIRPRATAPLGVRLADVHRALVEIVERVRPTHAAIEEVFFAKNVKSAIALGHARGVAMASVAAAGVELFEYAPTEVKRAVVGTGRAEKEQVAHMVKVLLGPDAAKMVQGQRLDVTDACAIAICHANTWRTKERIAGAR